MKMITGYLPPTSGTAVVDGFDVREAPLEVKRRIGYLPESSPSYPEMTVEEFLDFIAQVRQVGRARERRQRIAEIVELCRLTEVRRQVIETLSKGYKQRVGFAQAVLHDPPVLILDEPTDGLDPNQKHEVRRIIAGMATQKAIIMSTHILEEVDAICNRAIIIARGRVLVDETPDKLRARTDTGRLDDVFRKLTLNSAHS
jgi:ABC-2 type transport system ATP-binding protein